MTVEVLRPAELGEAELSAWRRFQDADPQLASPFLAPEFTLAVARQRPQSVRVAVLADGDGTAGFFPYEVAGRLGRPVGAGISDCQALIGRPGLEWDPVALVRACRLPVWEFDHLLASQRPFAPHHLRRRGSPVMDLSGGYDAYLRERRSATGHSVKAALRKWRKLARDCGEVRLDVGVAEPNLLATLMRWKSAQYRRTRQVDRFGTGWITAVVRDLAASRAPGCTGVVCALYAGDALVAVDFGLRSRSVLADWFPAYDPEFGSYSPGVVLALAMAEAVAADGVRYIDLGKGQAEFKSMLASRQIEVAEGVVAASRPVGLVRRTRHSAVAGLRGSALGRRLTSSRVGDLLKAARARAHRG